MQAAQGTLDYIVDTISAKHDLEQYLSLLKVDGKYVVVGVPPEPYQLNAGTLIFGKRLFMSVCKKVVWRTCLCVCQTTMWCWQVCSMQCVWKVMYISIVT